MGVVAIGQVDHLGGLGSIVPGLSIGVQHTDQEACFRR